jgi:hypothetical protein
MTSKLLRDLDASIRSTQDPYVWARSMCRLALHYARQGEAPHAVEVINAVRKRFDGSLGAEVAAWLMLAEGVLNFTSGDLDASVDRLKRSHAIARASNSLAVTPACAAWLAHMALNTRRFCDVTPFLREALVEAKPENSQALARASLVLADGFHYSGRFDLARPWYERARIHATNEGDEAAVSAMLHNVAAFRTANVRLADALGERLPEEAKRAAMEATSAAAYDHAIGTKSFGEFLPHVNEQLLIVDRKFGDALAQLSAIDVRGLPTRVHAVHYVDYATCAFETGDARLAEGLAESALNALNKYQMDPDDVAYVCCRLASIYRRSADSSSGDTLQRRASAAMEQHKSIQADLCNRLSELTATLASV